MILYNVTINIENSVNSAWLKWMKDVHIPEVMGTGFFTERKILKLIGDDESGGSTYAIQYTCKTMEDFMEYEERHAPALRDQHNEKFKDQFVAFRTLLEIID